MVIKNKGGGVMMAAKMLAHLDLASRKRILEYIARANPEIAEELKRNMVTFEDLTYLTLKMLQELLREIKIDDLALALRAGSDKLKQHILSNVSSNIRKDIEDVLSGPPQKSSKINEAMERIMSIVRVKVDRGELILDKTGSEKYV